MAFCSAAILAAADAPYLGHWKMNVAKSNFGETTLTYEQETGGQTKVTMDGQSYVYKDDGRDYRTPWGTTMAVKPVDARTWSVTEKIDGKVTATGTIQISADSKALATQMKRVRSDGGTSEDSATFQRVSGNSGLFGKWKTAKLTSSSPEDLSLSSNGADGVTIGIGNGGGVCDAKFDGKEYPARGTLLPAGWGCVVSRSGDRAIQVAWRREGKDMYKSTLTASADGKTLTETGSAGGTNERYMIAYDRQ